MRDYHYSFSKWDKRFLLNFPQEDPGNGKGDVLGIKTQVSFRCPSDPRDEQ